MFKHGRTMTKLLAPSGEASCLAMSPTPPNCLATRTATRPRSFR